MFKQFLFLAVFLALGFAVFGQVDPKDEKLKIFLVKANAGFYLPAADLANRFGYNTQVGVGLSKQFNGKWQFGFQSAFLFGNQVRENNVLNHLINSSGDITSERGFPAEYLFFQRGFNGFLQASRLFSIIGPNPNSGLLVETGLGFIQHKIKIETRATEPPQLAKPYLRGYDRSTAGIALQQFIGYQHLSNKRAINYYVGFELMVGFTQSMRSFDFDRMAADNQKRIDILYGFKAGWILPLYRRFEKDFYYFD